MYSRRVSLKNKTLNISFKLSVKAAAAAHQCFTSKIRIHHWLVHRCSEEERCRKKKRRQWWTMPKQKCSKWFWSTSEATTTIENDLNSFSDFFALKLFNSSLIQMFLRTLKGKTRCKNKRLSNLSCCCSRLTLSVGLEILFACQLICKTFRNSNFETYINLGQ